MLRVTVAPMPKCIQTGGGGLAAGVPCHGTAGSVVNLSLRASGTKSRVYDCLIVVNLVTDKNNNRSQ